MLREHWQLLCRRCKGSGAHNICSLGVRSYARSTKASSRRWFPCTQHAHNAHTLGYQHSRTRSTQLAPPGLLPRPATTWLASPGWGAAIPDGVQPACSRFATVDHTLLGNAPALSGHHADRWHAYCTRPCAVVPASKPQRAIHPHWLSTRATNIAGTCSKVHHIHLQLHPAREGTSTKSANTNSGLTVAPPLLILSLVRDTSPNVTQYAACTLV
jgi:hypothetical protein